MTPDRRPHRRPDRRAIALAAALPILVTAACQSSVAGPPDGADGELRPGYALLEGDTEVRLLAQADAFEPGAPVTLVLHNEGTEQIGFNLCFHVLERRDGEEWVFADDPERACTTQLNLLDTGGTADFATTIPGDLAPGEYRYRIAVHFMGREERRDQVSEPFQIGG